MEGLGRRCVWRGVLKEVGVGVMGRLAGRGRGRVKMGLEAKEATTEQGRKVRHEEGRRDHSIIL